MWKRKTIARGDECTWSVHMNSPIPPTATELEPRVCLSGERQGPGKGWGAALSAAVKKFTTATLQLFDTSFTTHVWEVAKVGKESSGSPGDRNWGAEGSEATEELERFWGLAFGLPELLGNSSVQLMKRAFLLIPTPLSSFLPALLHYSPGLKIAAMGSQAAWAKGRSGRRKYWKQGLGIESSHRGEGEDLQCCLRTATDPPGFLFQLVTKPINKLYLEGFSLKWDFPKLVATSSDLDSESVKFHGLY